jgi:NarL family two-component system response regulator LiaR
LRESFEIRDFRLDSDSAVSTKTLVPRSDVYLIDSYSKPAVTEALVEKVVQGKPDAKVVVFSEHFVEAVAFRLLQLGARGLMLYSEVRHLSRAMRFISESGYWVPRLILSKFVDSLVATQTLKVAKQTLLSPREQTILELLLRNLSNKEISSELKISERTVKFHVSNILSKYKVRRRADLILLQYQSLHPGGLAE